MVGILYWFAGPTRAGSPQTSNHQAGDNANAVFGAEATSRVGSPSPVRHGSSATSSGPRILRVAIIGLGTWGRQLIRVLDGVAEVAVAINRRDSAARDWLRDTYPAVSLGSSVTEAIDDETIDAVVIATPIATHSSFAISALLGRKHVFVEKPLATSAADAHRAVAAGAAAGRTLFVGHTFMYDAAFEALHAIVQDDPIETINLTWLKYGTFGEPLAWNLLSHEMAIAMWLTSARPSAEILERAGGPTPVDRLRLSLSFDADGPSGEILIDRLQDRKTKTAQVTLRSGAEYLWQDGHLDRVHRDGRRERIHDGTEESLKRELSAFLEAVATGRPPRSDGPFGAAVVEAIEPIAHELEAGPAAGGRIQR